MPDRMPDYVLEYSSEYLPENIRWPARIYVRQDVGIHVRHNVGTPEYMSNTVTFSWKDSLDENVYPLVIEHSYGKWLSIVDFPIENGDFPQLCNKLPEGIVEVSKSSARNMIQ